MVREVLDGVGCGTEQGGCRVYGARSGREQFPARDLRP